MTESGLPQVEPIATQAQLDNAAGALEKATNRLYHRTLAFEGWRDDDGNFHPGIGERYEISIKSKLIEIYDQAVQAEKRPPAEDIRTAIAEKSVRDEQPELYQDWKAASTEINALRIWISGMKQSISARQSVLKGERG